ncbi:MAG: alpha-2-macroglobulin [Planctomycetes bacterium]|nr:alpha-2-macroglobulin [Planctomycetota bacterium]
MLPKLVFALAALASILAVSGLADGADGPTAPDQPVSRADAREMYAKGFSAEAGEAFFRLAVDPASGAKNASEDLRFAIKAFMFVRDGARAAAVLNAVDTAWPTSWRVQTTIADVWNRIEYQPWLDSPMSPLQRNPERVRVENINRLIAAQAHFNNAFDPATEAERAEVYRLLASVILSGRNDDLAWRLTEKTDLSDPLLYDDAPMNYSYPRRSAPVNPDGTPVYHHIPASWDEATTDGERWRWAIEQMAAHGDSGGRDLAFGRFLLGQFGVQTMNLGPSFGNDADAAGDTGPFAVRTLRDDETIAKLATGLKRFTMPDEFNFIRRLQAVRENGDESERARAIAVLAGIYENRQQYGRAADLWRELTAYPATHGVPDAEAALRRIVDNNGLLETGPVAPAGKTTTLSYLFRNGTAVHFRARRLDEKKLLNDIVLQLKQGDDNIFQNYTLRRPAMLGRRVVEADEDKYVGDTVAEWDVALEPLRDHYSRRVMVDLPFNQAGCYLVEATMADGNTSRVVLWINDLALVRMTTGNQKVHFVADAVSGELVPGASLSFHGIATRWHGNGRRFVTDEFAERTDTEGLAVIPGERLNEKEWLTIATTDDGRMAYLGFESMWEMYHPEEPEIEPQAYLLTDRPVYRPGDAVRFKLWLGHATYGRSPVRVDGVDVPVTVYNPRGEKVYEKTLATDEWGGIDDSLTLGKDAPLGYYSIQTKNGAVGFRLEEYRNPEFEVTVETPDKALLLGDAVQVKVKAAYYYGAPVANGTVAYKVVRTGKRSTWTPPWRWDWLYGNGASIRQYDYSWYPGWDDWRLPAPLPPWLPVPYSQPEVVADGEGALDADGMFRLTLDTAAAKELYGDQDHSYEISVEVTDASRRVITGSGTVVAARKPFSVNVWADRGFYRAGQEMTMSVAAVLPQGGPVAAEGTGTLYSIAYSADGVPTETVAATYPGTPGADGRATVAVSLKDAGQYRFAVDLTDADGNRVEGGALLTVRGETGDGDFRFAALELVPEKVEYRPGETLRLAVRSENGKGVVVLFPRAERNGVPTPGGSANYFRPEVIRLENGERLWETDIARADQPNFFCEAVTVYEGRVYVETREIFVPPADKTLTVDIAPDQKTYAPAGEASFTIRVTDVDGEPVVGQVAVSVYDRSVDYIAGGAGPQDIRSAFWQWKKRYFNSQMADSLSRRAYSAMKRGDRQWEPIGIFGSQEADWSDSGVLVNGKLDLPIPRPSMARAGYGAAEVMLEAAPMAAMSADAEESVAVPALAPMQSRNQVAPATGGAMAKEMDTGGQFAETTVRSDFADTAFWSGTVVTDDNGTATITFTMPENLTAWRARVWTMSTETRVGQGETQVETKKNVIVRPATPRFLTQKDEVILSATLHNYLPRAKRARAELVLEGGLLEAADRDGLVIDVDLAAGGEERVDWLVRAKRPGEARVVMKLLTDEESDAAEVFVPVVVHGSRRVVTFGGVVRGEATEAVIPLTVPEERLPDQSRLEVSLSANVAGAVLDALPFLIEYPYGCTEQTLNRFLPVVMARRFLEASGADLKAAEFRIDNAPADTPEAEAWKRTFSDPLGKRAANAVFDDAELVAMVKAGVERLASMQNPDGGWGWFSGIGERSWPHTTAVVVYGLLAARDNGVALPYGLLDRGIDWLRARQAQEIARLKIDPDDKNTEFPDRVKAAADNMDAFTYLILAKNGRQPLDPDMRDFLYRDRLKLSQSGLAMFAIALHLEKATNALLTVDRNLRQYLRTDEQSGTAWLETANRGWWFWYNDAVETQAWYLKYLALSEPKGAVASGVAKYLMENRKNGSYWKSTRDSAYAIEALTDYSLASGEAKPDFGGAVYLDDELVLERRFTAENALGVERFSLDGLAVDAGEHTIRLVRTGGGNLYYGGSLRLFSLEDPIPAAAGDLAVERTFYRLVRDDRTTAIPDASGTARDGRVEHYRRELLASPFDADGTDAGTSVQPGDLVEVELTVTARNDYEYIVFEDMKAAGLEAVEMRSGYRYGDGLGAYVEYRDDKVVLFVQHLRRGTHTLAYRFRAENPGMFSALPTFGGGMYATDFRANSGEMKVRIVEDDVYGD